MKTDAAGRPGRSLYLPDFCTSRAALVLILIVELTAVVVTLARQSLEGDFWADLARTSLISLDRLLIPFFVGVSNKFSAADERCDHEP